MLAKLTEIPDEWDTNIHKVVLSLINSIIENNRSNRKFSINRVIIIIE